MFIASALYRGKLRDGPARETRDDAARALFAEFPTLKECSTAKAYQDGADAWRTIGSDSRPAYRHKLET
jgi:hypothetical protein